jgi:hypothetical protein
MRTTQQIQVRVNEELTLDGGTWEDVASLHAPERSERVIRPPRRTLFRQLLAYLEAKPDPPKRSTRSGGGSEGVAAAAVALRWGSYFAVLCDRDKPLWAATRSSQISRISDGEMARINIEASAALADWVDLRRSKATVVGYHQLVNRALAYLPMPKKTPKLKISEFRLLAEPKMVAQLLTAIDAGRIARVSADAQRSPSRMFANALLNTAWRNGPVEDVHAGEFKDYPLDQARVTQDEERALMDFASERLALGMAVVSGFAAERPQRVWSEQVLPYGLAEMLMITPSGWTLTEVSREIRLPVGMSPRSR